MTIVALAPVLTPHGHLVLVASDDVPALDAAIAQRLTEAFHRGSGHGLLQLGAGEIGTVLPPSLAYWRELGARFAATVCALPDVEELRTQARIPTLPSHELEDFALAAPPMTGAEYLRPAVLQSLWAELDRSFRAELAESRDSVQDFLKSRNPAWNLVGRVHFNLAENRRDEEAPFAFLATYTTRLSAHAKPQHLPLGQALREYSGTTNQERLLSLLLPVQRASEKCLWLKELVDSSEIFHPLRWSPAQAFRFLNDIPTIETSGVVVRAPASWNAKRPPRPLATASIGSQKPAGLGKDSLLDFQMAVTLHGEPLTAEEIKQLLSGTDGLAMIRGHWIEIDQERLRHMLDQHRQVERLAAENGLSFFQAMRLLSRADVSGEMTADEIDRDWSQVVAGPWLAQTLAELRNPQALSLVATSEKLRATLRPYQRTGVHWLYLLSKLGLGACLADDMGLGKTIQVLALLLALQSQQESKKRPSILVAPASLLANWTSEIERFAPNLRALIAHPSAMSGSPDELKSIDEKKLANFDLVITSYGSLLRIPWLLKTEWQLAVLDEAQAIKNPGAKQTRAVKTLHAQSRIALTGTPVENNLSDLWSIFDFINPGLLGTGKQFTTFSKGLSRSTHNPYASLRELVRPYILRRLKTDQSVIADLPDKTEVTAFCQLSRKQAVLYQQAVTDLAQQLETPIKGIRRKGLVLSALMRFKQICNHPSQWLGDGSWAESESGKLMRLREIAEVIAAKQEKVLVFTQYREITTPLAEFLGSVFGRRGLILHGETMVKKRQELVRQFQEDENIPFFVLSLKAGGSGLNLTAASHVVHFDRWWNPAVENQATDRAFRIGQTRNVLVHKFVCSGTVEEKIDDLMESKRKLSEDLLQGGAELLLTEMKDDDLLKLVALDLKSASSES